MTIIKGTFTSYWDEGPVETSATLCPDTMEIETGTVEVGEEYETLDYEEFVAEDGTTYKVCPECHQYALKYSIEEGVGKQLYEIYTCKGCEIEIPV